MRMHFFTAGCLLALTCLPATAPAADTPPIAETPPASTLPGARPFTTPGAVEAQNQFVAEMKAAREKFDSDLEQSVKAALTAGRLEDANAISLARQKLTADAEPVSAGPFQTPQANEARMRYDTTVGATQRQYGRELKQALKQAMSSANLAESNLINDEIKSLLTVLKQPAATSATLPPTGTGNGIGGNHPPAKSPGLEMVSYPRHPNQGSKDNYNAYMSLEDLVKGTPKGPPQTVKSLSKWTKDRDDNAVVSGFIKIDKQGLYEFRTNSDFDRNELIIKGQIVCSFRDGEDKVQSIRLKPGLIPIKCIGFANRTTDIFVQWHPPGQTDWSDIPDDLLSH